MRFRIDDVAYTRCYERQDEDAASPGVDVVIDRADEEAIVLQFETFDSAFDFANHLGTFAAGIKGRYEASP